VRSCDESKVAHHRRRDRTTARQILRRRVLSISGGIAAVTAVLVYSSFGRGFVLPAGNARTLLTLPAGTRAGAFWLAAQTRPTIVCYCFGLRRVSASRHARG
jgi:hypothetical protein